MMHTVTSSGHEGDAARQVPGARRGWRLPLVVATSGLALTGVAAGVATSRGDLRPAPPPALAPSSAPAPSDPSQAPAAVPTTTPTVPQVVGKGLFVGGEQVDGTWWTVRGVGTGWLAQRTDDTWWWGRGTEPQALPGERNQPPAISPGGSYVAEVLLSEGGAVVTGLDIAAGGAPLSRLAVDLGDPGYVTVRGVTDDARVIVQGEGRHLMWLPLAGGRVVDLAVTAPEQLVLASTPAGLLVTDGENGQPYLAELADSGELTRTATVPFHDDLLVSPGGRWLATVAPGSLGGEVASVGTLEARALDGTGPGGTGPLTLRPPSGWSFRVHAWAWEDDEHLVSAVVRDGSERMVRCAVPVARCVLVAGH